MIQTTHTCNQTQARKSTMPLLSRACAQPSQDKHIFKEDNSSQHANIYEGARQFKQTTIFQFKDCT